jgi:hypothetical protein
MRQIFYKIFSINFICILTYYTAYSQILKNIDNANIESGIYYGFVLKHRQSLGYYIKGHVPAFEININFNSRGNKIFHQVFRYPRFGAGYYYADPGNPQILGRIHSLFLLIDIPVIRNRVSINYRVAGGVSYLTKCFDITNNYYNTAIGSNFNIFVNLGLNIKINLSNRMTFSNGLSIVHCSNGAVKVPNLGINIISYNIGLLYKLNNALNKTQQINLPAFQKKNEYSMIFTNGLKEISQPGGKKYYAYSLCLNFDRIVNFKRKLGAGLDLFNDISLYSILRSGSTSTSYKEVLRIGTHFSTDLIFENLCFTIQEGVYIYQKYFKDGYLYSRYGFKYFTGKHLIVNLSLKTHIIKADFIEFGIGYKI